MPSLCGTRRTVALLFPFSICPSFSLCLSSGFSFFIDFTSSQQLSFFHIGIFCSSSSLSRYPVRNSPLLSPFPLVRSARLVSTGRCALLVLNFWLGVSCAIADATPTHHHHHTPPSGVFWEQVRESHDPCHAMGSTDSEPFGILAASWHPMLGCMC